MDAFFDLQLNTNMDEGYYTTLHSVVGGVGVGGIITVAIVLPETRANCRAMHCFQSHCTNRKLLGKCRVTCGPLRYLKLP